MSLWIKLFIGSVLSILAFLVLLFAFHKFIPIEKANGHPAEECLNCNQESDTTAAPRMEIVAENSIKTKQKSLKKKLTPLQKCFKTRSNKDLASGEALKFCQCEVFKQGCPEKKKEIILLPTLAKGSKNPYAGSSLDPTPVRPRRAGSFFDFVSHEYQSILRWECNTLGKNKQGMVYCKKPETYLKDNDEFNVMGLLQSTNPKCHHQFYKTLFNGTRDAIGLYKTAQSGEDIVKRCYYQNYFKRYRDMNKCLRLFVFEMSVLSGHRRAVKTLQKTLGVKQDGIMGPKTEGKIDGSVQQLKKTKGNFIAFLKGIKKKNGNLWDGWKRKDGTVFGGYKNGWTNRLNFDYDRSVEFCNE